MHARVPVTVFSDLDGVFRHPSEGLIARAAVLLCRLSAERVSIVLCSLKSRAELQVLQYRLGLYQPFIAEGGAAVFIPEGYFGPDVLPAGHGGGDQVIAFGAPYADVVRKLRETTQQLDLQIMGFNDMSVAAVAGECDIPLLEARLAKLREYVEIFRLVNPTAYDRARLLKVLLRSGLHCHDHGRHSYVGSVVDNARAVAALRHLYERADRRTITIGFADAFADASLLRAIDHPVIIQDDDSMSGAGDVRGWAEAIFEAAREARQRAAAAVPLQARHSPTRRWRLSGRPKESWRSAL
jgi:mannosyl-3-phosphoglycerate phosphatase